MVPTSISTALLCFLHSWPFRLVVFHLLRDSLVRAMRQRWVSISLHSGAFFLPLRLEVRAPLYKGLPKEHNHRISTFVSVTIAIEASQRQQGAVLPLARSCLSEVLQRCCFWQQFGDRLSGPRVHPPSRRLVGHVKEFRRPAPSLTRAAMKKAGSEDPPSFPLGTAFKLRLYHSPLPVLHLYPVSDFCRSGPDPDPAAGLPGLTSDLPYHCCLAGGSLSCVRPRSLSPAPILTWTCWSASALPVSGVTHCSALSGAPGSPFPMEQTAVGLLFPKMTVRGLLLSFVPVTLALKNRWMCIHTKGQTSCSVYCVLTAS